MSTVISRFFRCYTIYCILFLLYLATFIFTGFFFHLYINHWTLVSAFASYVTIGFCCLLYRRANKERLAFLFAAAIITPLLFWGLAAAFGHTYDTGYDGQDYHESAIIELSNGWNPIYQKTQPIKLTNKIDEPVDSGYGKIIWSIEASIYQLTHTIDSAAAINLIVGLLAFSLFYQMLKQFLVGKLWPVMITFLTLVTPLFIEQIFTFREDSISYEFLIIGIASLILLVMNNTKLVYYLCLLTAFIFLAGIKDSNLFIFLPLFIVSFYLIIKNKLYRLQPFWITAVLGLITGFVLLFNPYMTNILRYHALDYPFNQKTFADSIEQDSVPLNLRNDNRLSLFYYGIFSAAANQNTQSPAGDAHLKIPFTVSNDELIIEASVAAKNVGGYGVYFSGAFVISIFAYLYLAARKKSKANMKVFGYLSLTLLLIVFSCLLSPAPNYTRYGSQLFLFPIAVVIALLVTKRSKSETIIATALIVVLFMNVLSDLPIALGLRGIEFSTINTQLSALQDSHKTYLVYADAFYSNYVRLKEHGVKIIVSPKPINCAQPIILDYSFGQHALASTELCQI
jgi:hypothetical protein